MECKICQPVGLGQLQRSADYFESSGSPEGEEPTELVREAKPRAVLRIMSRPGCPGSLGPASPGWGTSVREHRPVQCQRVPSSGLRVQRTEHRRPMDNNKSHYLSPGWAAKCKARTAWCLLLPWQRCFILAGKVHGEDRINTAGNDTRTARVPSWGISRQALPRVGQQWMRRRRDAWKLAAPSSTAPSRARPSSQPRALGLSTSLPRALESEHCKDPRAARGAGERRCSSLMPTSLRSFCSSATSVPLSQPHGHPHG